MSVLENPSSGARDLFKPTTLLILGLFAAASSFIFHFKIFALIGLLILSHFALRYRRVLLTAACLLKLVWIDLTFTNFGLGPLHFVPFYLFNAAFIFSVDRFKVIRRHYLPMVLVLVAGLVTFQYTASAFLLNQKLAMQICVPIILNVWTYMNYVKVPLHELHFVERVIWLRPFWYEWIIPFGSNVEVKHGLLARPQFDAARFSRFAWVSILFFVSLFLYENAIFNKTFTFSKASWVPRLFDIPLVSTQGFYSAFDRFPLDRLSEAGQGWAFLAVQSAAALHFILFIGLFSSFAITMAVLAGFDIPLHVQAMWRANSFSEFYIKTTYHYSYLIRTHLMPALARLRIPGLSGRLKQATNIGISIFIISSVSLFFGRSHWLGPSFDFTKRLELSTYQLQYPILVGLICALNIAFNRGPKDKIKRSLLSRSARLALYFFIFQFTLIFGFQFLRTDSETKVRFATAMLQIFNPASYRIGDP